MAGYSLKARNLISTWLNLGFFILLFSFIVFIEFFQNHHTQKSALELLENPINESLLSVANQLTFENRLGVFKAVKQNDNWVLQEPRVIPAKQDTIQRIFKIISDISIKTIHQNEPINIQTFSLNNPIMKIELKDKNEKKLSIKIGLINPIDETSYITVNDNDLIYQTNLLSGRLESLELADFIDSKIFTPKLSNIKNIKIFYGQTQKARSNFTFENNAWNTEKYNIYSQEKLSNRIEEILDIRTHAIIDKASDEVQNLLANYLENPKFTIKIKTNDGESITYKASYITREIKDLKIEKKQFFIMSATDRPYPYIIPKKYLDIFLINYSDIRR